VDVDLPDCYGKKVDINTDNTEDRAEEGEDKMDISLDPAEVIAPIHTHVVKESVHQQGEEHHEERSDVSQHLILSIPRVIWLEYFNQQHVDLETSNQHPEE